MRFRLAFLPLVALLGLQVVQPGLPQATANGQLPIAASTGVYAAATLTAGTCIGVTNGANTITLAGTCIGLLDRSTTEQDVNTTTTETSVYSFSVPGGTLSTNRILRLTVTGAYLNNSGGADTFTLRVKFGGTTYASGAPSLGANVNRRPMRVLSELNANGATNSQRAYTTWTFGSNGSADNTFDTAQNSEPAYSGALAIDTTASQTITVTVQHATSAATISFKRWGAMLELLQ